MAHGQFETPRARAVDGSHQPERRATIDFMKTVQVVWGSLGGEGVEGWWGEGVWGVGGGFWIKGVVLFGVGGKLGRGARGGRGDVVLGWS